MLGDVIFGGAEPVIYYGVTPKNRVEG